MGKVTYGQEGYCGSSMSKRAAGAYAGGEMPKSRWTKKAMVATLREYCESCGFELPGEVEEMRKDDVFSRFFVWAGWHHTGKFANETDFYGVDEDAVWDMAPEDVKEAAEAEERKMLAEAAARRERELREARAAMPQWARDAQARAGIEDGVCVPLADKIEHDGWEVEELANEDGSIAEVLVLFDVSDARSVLGYNSPDDFERARIPWNFAARGKEEDADA